MSEPVNRFHGMSLSAWEKALPNNLNYDAEGLYSVVGGLRGGFGLRGGRLVDAVRRNVLNLLQLGARPVLGAPKVSRKFWIEQLQYGSEPEQIADNLIKEWLEAGCDPDISGVWLAIREDIDAEEF